MGVRIEITLFGDTQLSRELVRTGDRATELKPAFRSIMDRLLEINAEQFRSQGLRGSGGWAPLAPSTLARKSRLGFDTDILFETHALYEAMSSPSSPHNETLIADTWAVFRVPDDGDGPGHYGPFHQTGTLDEFGDLRMPRRPPFALTARDRDEFIDEMSRYIFSGRLGGFL